jgi:uncharacterized protein with GYD domain
LATYVALFHFTAQGVKNIKDSPRRAQALTALAKSKGAKVREVLWTIGHYDGVLIYDAPDDETSAALMLSLASKGNVQTETLRAFEAKDFSAILKNISE